MNLYHKTFIILFAVKLILILNIKQNSFVICSDKQKYKLKQNLKMCIFQFIIILYFRSYYQPFVFISFEIKYNN